MTETTQLRELVLRVLRSLRRRDRHRYRWRQRAPLPPGARATAALSRPHRRSADSAARRVRALHRLARRACERGWWS